MSTHFEATVDQHPADAHGHQQSFVERWLVEWPRQSEATNRLYAAAARRFAAHFGPTPVGEVERQYCRPRGILWDHLQPPQIREIPVLERMGYA